MKNIILICAFLAAAMVNANDRAFSKLLDMSNQLIALEQEYSAGNSRWSEEKMVLEAELALIQNQISSLDEKLVGSQKKLAEKSAAADEQNELVKVHEHFIKELQKSLIESSRQLSTVVELIPENERNEVQLLCESLLEEKDLVVKLNRFEQLSESLRNIEDAVTVNRETIVVSDDEIFSVDIVRIGLAVAFARFPDKKRIGVGSVTGSHWKWMIVEGDELYTFVTALIEKQSGVSGTFKINLDEVQP